MIMKSVIKQVMLFLVSLSFAISGGLHAASGNYSSDTNLEPFLELIEAGQYTDAIDELHVELDIDPDNADIMALIGYSYRKSENYEDALTYYTWALQAEPKHKGANEYLGQLYLETDQLSKAVEQLEVLDGLCFFTCIEYKTLKKAIDTFKQQASN